MMIFTTFPIKKRIKGDLKVINIVVKKFCKRLKRKSARNLLKMYQFFRMKAFKMNN